MIVVILFVLLVVNCGAPMYFMKTIIANKGKCWETEWS